MEAVDLLEAGRQLVGVAVDLGGGVYKLRLARTGEGKSSQTSFATDIV